MTEKDKKRTEEYQKRARVIEIMKKHMALGGFVKGTDPAVNYQTVFAEFKKTLSDMDLPFTLLTIRAMIEGATYMKVAMENATPEYPAEMSLGLLYCFEEDAMKRIEEMRVKENKTP